MIVIIGVGNPLREDDGAGIWCLKEIQRHCKGVLGIVYHEVFQLTPELLEYLLDASHVFILDAANITYGTLGVSLNKAPIIDHRCDIRDFIRLAKVLLKTPPTIEVWGFGGTHFGMCESPSKILQKTIQTTAHWLADDLKKLLAFRQIYTNNGFYFTKTHFTIESYFETSFKSESIGIITAHNPQNHILSKEENGKRNGILEAELKKDGWDYEPCIGKLDHHEEAGFLLYGVSFKQIIAYGKKCNQYAIFFGNSEKAGYYEVATSREILKLTQKSL